MFINWFLKLFKMNRKLTGDGTWPFFARIDGEDIVVDCEGVFATCFGGAYDNEDNGETASGVSTKKPGVIGCALPVVASFKATSGSPLAFKTRIPWQTPVDITIKGVTIKGVPLLDNGPAKSASKPGFAHAIDLTVAAAAQFATYVAPSKLADQFFEPVSFRIKGAAKYAD